MNATKTPALPPFVSGDIVKVLVKVHDEGRVRVREVEGHVVKCSGAGEAATFTLRRRPHGLGVERTFQLNAPEIIKIDVVRRAVRELTR